MKFALSYLLRSSDLVWPIFKLQHYFAEWCFASLQNSSLSSSCCWTLFLFLWCFVYCFLLQQLWSHTAAIYTLFSAPQSSAQNCRTPKARNDAFPGVHSLSIIVRQIFLSCYASSCNICFHSYLLLFDADDHAGRDLRLIGSTAESTIRIFWRDVLIRFTITFTTTVYRSWLSQSEKRQPALFLSS